MEKMGKMPARRILVLSASLVPIIVTVAWAAVWDLTKPNTIAAGNVKCRQTHDETTIWESQRAGNAVAGCNVKVTYRGPNARESACKAVLSWNKAGGGPKGMDGPVQAGDPARTITVSDARAIQLECNGTESDRNESCHWEISQVDCISPPDTDAVIPMGAAVVLTPVKCRAKQSQIWKPPAAPGAKRDSCRVTVQWLGAADCEAVLAANYHDGSQKEETAKQDSRLITFVNPKELLMECKGNGSHGCRYAIVSTECK